MTMAQADCNASAVVFARRVVTRAPTTAEDHDSVNDDAFDSRLEAGGFAFWWEAHGLKYGIPSTIDDDIVAGRTVVCNVSRSVVSHLRRRYVRCVVVLVTAPTDVLLARLASRQRSSDGDLAQRLVREAPSEAELGADVVIDNVGSPQQGAAALTRLLRGEG
jgi:ribose 1,5-bisphosphokinase